MVKNKKLDNYKVLQLFSELTSNITADDRNIFDISDPVYYQLSKQLKTTKKKIFRIIVNFQPIVSEEKYSEPNEEHKQNVDNKPDAKDQQNLDNNNDTVVNEKQSEVDIRLALAIEDILADSDVDGTRYSDEAHQQNVDNKPDAKDQQNLDNNNDTVANEKQSEVDDNSDVEQNEKIQVKDQTIKKEFNLQTFSEYEQISTEQFDSNEFRQKYEKVLIVNNKVLPSSAPVIKDLAEKMNKTPKAVFLMINRRFLPPAKKKTEDDDQSNEVKTIEQSKETENNIETLNLEKKEKTQSIEVNEEIGLESFSGEYDLEDNALFETEIRSTIHRKKIVRKQIVKEGWTTKLGMFLYEKTKLSCKFAFKHIWILKSGVISTTGTCLCNSIVDIKCSENILKVEISGINKEYNHTEKYQFRGELRQQMSDKLKNNSALCVRTGLINDICPNNNELNKSFNPFVPKLNAIRTIKYRNNKKDDDPVDVLLNWMNSEYRNVITAIGHAPFYVFYQTTLQHAWFLAEFKKHKRISISIDATGSVVKPPIRSKKMEGSDKLKHIFLYAIMAKTESGKSVPIAQMLSQDQSSEFIAFFILKMFKNMRLPQEVVCDESKALLKALTNTLTTCASVENYVDRCMSSLQKEIAPPECFIRIDRSHFVKNITRKIKYRDYRKRNLCRCVIGFLIQCDDFKIAEQIIYDFFTLILNENDGCDELGAELPTESAKKRLLKLCAMHDQEEYIDELDSSDTNDAESLESFVDLEFDSSLRWLHDIIDKIVIKKSEHYHENLYYSPNDAKMYEKIFSSIVLWSNVMNNIFDSAALVATSSDVESYFKSLKHGILKQKILRADDFIQMHINFINAEIKLNAMANKQGSNTIGNRKRSNSVTEKCSITAAKRKRSSTIDENCMRKHASQNKDDEENWRNKNPPTNSVVKTRRSIQSLLNPLTASCSKIMYLRNGFLSKHRSYSIQTIHTCAFDSFLMNIAGIYADFSNVKNNFDEFVKEYKFPEMVSSIFSNDDSISKRQNRLLQKRNIVLLDIFKETSNAIQFNNGLISLNCATNVNCIIPKLLPQNLYSYLRKKQCNNCNRTVVSNRCFVDIEFELFEKKGIQELNNCLLDTLISEMPSYCISCEEPEQITTTEFSSFILIDLQLEHGLKKFALNDIPKSLNILDIKFLLTGCIEFIGDATQSNQVGHYISHLYRSNKQWEMYDDFKSNVSRSNPSSKIQAQILFYVKQEE